MSTGAIVAIAVVAAIILLALVFLMPRMRERGRIRKRERELEQRRETAAAEHRGEAEQRAQSAEAAEQRARIAEQEAQRERAEADLHKERAHATEQGMADRELIDDHEREHFAGTSAGVATNGADGDGDGAAERDRTTAYSEDRAAAGDPRRQADFEDGRVDQTRRTQRSGGLLGRFRRKPADDRETTRT
jgi:hypothetical protein